MQEIFVNFKYMNRTPVYYKHKSQSQIGSVQTGLDRFQCIYILFRFDVIFYFSEYVHHGCTLKFVLDWAWNRVVSLKTSIDNTCKSNIYPLQLQWNLSNTTHQGTREICQIVLILRFYLTLCTFSFEINESRLSDTRCCITTLW